MSTAAEQAEAARAASAYQQAVNTLGVVTVAQSLELWKDVPPNAPASTIQRWLGAMRRLLMGKRSESKALARSYYRYVRALETGATVNDPTRTEASHTSLNALREQFNEQLAAVGGRVPQAQPISSPGGAEGRENDPDDEDSILIEEIARLKELEDRNDRLAEQEIQTALSALGPANQDKLVRLIDQELTAEEVDAARAQAHTKAGARQAAASARIAMNGARSTSWLLQEGDKRALGWVRISTTGTPCGWCAMLISRGPVYRSQRSATVDYNDGDTYHDNCHCIAIPVFSKDFYEKSPLFDLNRKYAELWPQVTKGLGSGKEALSAWRYFIRSEQKPRAS